LNCCNNSLEHLKSITTFSTISSALDSTVFTLQYCPFKESKTKQLNFYIIMLGTMNPNVSHNITLLQSLLFNTILIFLMSKSEEWESILLHYFSLTSFLSLP
jgi:hypothetical protein